MGYYKESLIQFFTCFFDGIGNLNSGNGVHGTGGFIQNYYFWFLDKHLGYGHPVAFPSTQLIMVFVEYLLRIVFIKSHGI
ncbi:hypothetical protein DSECCO2_662800 [anaerobic digester metagenome]